MRLMMRLLRLLLLVTVAPIKRQRRRRLCEKQSIGATLFRQLLAARAQLAQPLFARVVGDNYDSATAAALLFAVVAQATDSLQLRRANKLCHLRRCPTQLTRRN